MAQMARLTEGYLHECEIRGVGSATLASRRRELERLELWLRRRPRLGVGELTGEHLFLYVRARTRFRAKATLSGVLSQLRCFGEYLVAQQVWRENPLRWIRGPKPDPRRPLPRRVGREHLTRLFAEAARAHRTHHRHLWPALLAVCYGTGLRRGELERLNLADFDRTAGLLRIDGRKTGVERRVPLPAVAVQLLEAYLPHRFNALSGGPGAEPALFVSGHGQRLRGERIGHALQGLARRAALPRVTLHQFRHSCAADLLEAGVGLPEIQRILGHASTGSTCRYAQVADPARREAMAQHPINAILADPASQEVHP